MADDDVKEPAGEGGDGAGDSTPKTPDTPSFDAAALGKQISDQVAQGLAQVIQRQQVPQQAPQQDALEEVIQPYIHRAAGPAMVAAQLAADKADFYLVADEDERANRLELRDEIEKRVANLLAAGRPLPRQDIYDHLRGGEKFQEFAEKWAKRKARTADRAAGDADYAGHGSRPASRGQVTLDRDRAYALAESGKLDAELEGKAF